MQKAGPKVKHKAGWIKKKNKKKDEKEERNKYSFQWGMK
jgi:hypothetical protein